MADRQCPFYVYESTGWFSSRETCRSTGREISATTYNTYCNNYESGYSKCPNFKPEEDKSGCFITSACVEAMGLCDCCNELTCLRSFRDNWLANQPGGKEDINEYYRIAPQIVERIRGLHDPKSVFKELYDELVIPCVKLIDCGLNDEAWQLYGKMVVSLKEKYEIG